MSASDYRSSESKCGVVLMARREIHDHANLLLLRAKGVIQRLRVIDFLIHFSFMCCSLLHCSAHVDITSSVLWQATLNQLDSVLLKRN